jgi:hypothetical protein
VKRVPLGFGYPLNQTWEGYLLPEWLHEVPCQNCNGTGGSPEYDEIYKKWYGQINFDPSETGSEPLTPQTPAVRTLAERKVERDPSFYGRGEMAIEREAQRLAQLWNGQWCHHLEQVDVDALLAKDRLRDLTHTSVKGEGWQPRDPMPKITPEMVNEWSILSFGHDAINCWTVVEAKCKRLGLPTTCQVCEGHGCIEKWPGQRKVAEEWKGTEPPTGDGYQLWQSVSEGGPVSPVFKCREDLAMWLTDNEDVAGIKYSTKDWLKVIDDESHGLDVATGDLV